MYRGEGWDEAETLFWKVPLDNSAFSHSPIPITDARDEAILETAHLSFSRLNRYLSRPGQYRLYYVENLRRCRSDKRCPSCWRKRP